MHKPIYMPNLVKEFRGEVGFLWGAKKHNSSFPKRGKYRILYFPRFQYEESMSLFKMSESISIFKASISMFKKYIKYINIFKKYINIYKKKYINI